MAIPKYVRAVRKQFLYMLWLQLGMFVIGVALVIIINGLFNEDRDYACIGTLMALSGVIAGEALQLNNVDFRLAVLMGETRHHYLLWKPLVSLVAALQGWLTAFCLYKLEMLLYSVIYPGYESGLPIGAAFKWPVVLLSAVAVSIICLFLGALYAKFGPKGTMTVWLIFWSGCMLIPQGIDQFQSGRTSLLAKLGWLTLTVVELLTPAMWGAVGGALLLCALAFSVRVYLRAEVRL